MREYKGKSAKKYSQAESKLMILFPVFDKLIPKVENAANFLDLGCGLADYSQNVIPKGYEYYGIDSSSDMIKRAKELFPTLNLVVANGRSFADKFNISFDVILISMVFLTMYEREDIEKTLMECKKVLSVDGKILIGDVHPACDPYMQKHYFGRDDIVGEFCGYFKSGIEFKVHKKWSTGDFCFHDHHFTLRDYVDSINNAGLKLLGIDECEPQKKFRSIDPEYFDKKKDYPTFMVLTCIHS